MVGIPATDEMTKNSFCQGKSTPETSLESAICHKRRKGAFSGLRLAVNRQWLSLPAVRFSKKPFICFSCSFVSSANLSPQRLFVMLKLYVGGF